jgi:hypothetical protein
MEMRPALILPRIIEDTAAPHEPIIVSGKSTGFGFLWAEDWHTPAIVDEASARLQL